MPSRRRDVIPLPGSKPEPVHPLEAINNDPGKRKGRRRRAPQTAEDPRDEVMRTVIERVQAMNAQLGTLTDRLTIALVQVEWLRRKVLALETAAAGPQTPAGDVAAPGADRSDVPTPGSP
jgi:hypothetical protein